MTVFSKVAFRLHLWLTAILDSFSTSLIDAPQRILAGLTVEFSRVADANTE